MMMQTFSGFSEVVRIFFQGQVKKSWNQKLQRVCRLVASNKSRSLMYTYNQAVIHLLGWWNWWQTLKPQFGLKSLYGSVLRSVEPVEGELEETCLPDWWPSGHARSQNPNRKWLIWKTTWNYQEMMHQRCCSECLFHLKIINIETIDCVKRKLILKLYTAYHRS